jgi:hypothetical protein
MTFASYLVFDLVTTRVLWACVVSAVRDGDYEVAAYFAHILADLASA